MWQLWDSRAHGDVWWDESQWHSEAQRRRRAITGELSGTWGALRHSLGRGARVLPLLTVSFLISLVLLLPFTPFISCPPALPVASPDIARSTNRDVAWVKPVVMLPTPRRTHPSSFRSPSPLPRYPMRLSFFSAIFSTLFPLSLYPGLLAHSPCVVVAALLFSSFIFPATFSHLTFRISLMSSPFLQL